MSAIIALLAQETQQDTLVSFVAQHINVLSHYRLMAAENTALSLQQRTGLTIEKVLPLSQGGDIHIAAQITSGESVVAVIFLLDPNSSTVHELPIQNILRICNIYNISIATNTATAAAIIAQLRRTRSAYLIFNPISGGGNANQELLQIRQLLEPYFHLKVRQTTLEISAEQLAQEAVNQDVDVVIASGGDGTVSVVAGAVMKTNIPLGIIPRGTANAFSVALGIPTNIQGACEVIIAGLTRTVDAAYCNGKPMILLAGVGYEAETVSKADREAKKRWGPLAYFMAGWQQLNEQTDFDTEITIDDTVHQVKVAAITIANAAPPTSILAQGLGQVIPDDGVLEVIMYTAPGDTGKMQAALGMLRLFGAALLNIELQGENVLGFRTQRIKVNTNPPQKVVLDGEIIGTTPLEVECIPNGLKVLTPLLPSLPTVETTTTPELEDLVTIVEEV